MNDHSCLMATARRFLGMLLPAAALALFWCLGSALLTGRFAAHPSPPPGVPGDPSTDPIAAQNAHHGYLSFLNSGHLR